MLNAKLVVVGGDAKAKEVKLNLPTVIGRGKDVTLTLPHALVSRQHTEIFEKDGWLFVKDLGSLNGTYVNNRRIKEAQKLPPNHLLTLGNVTFRAVYDAPVSTIAETETHTESDKDETIDFKEFAETPIDERETLPSSEAVLQSKSQPANEPSVASSSQSGASPGQATEKAPELGAAGKKPSKDSADEIDDCSEQPEVAELRKAIPTEPASDSSSIFSGGEDFISPEKSISVSALEALPSQGTPSSISFVGNQLKDIAGPEKPAVDSIDLDVLGEARSPAQSDPDLGSFLKKVPR